MSAPEGESGALAREQFREEPGTGAGGWVNPPENRSQSFIVAGWWCGAAGERSRAQTAGGDCRLSVSSRYPFIDGLSLAAGCGQRGLMTALPVPPGNYSSSLASLPPLLSNIAPATRPAFWRMARSMASATAGFSLR